MIANMAFRFPVAALTPEMVYDAAKIWLDHASLAHPDFTRWWLMPRTAKEGYVPFSDRIASIARIEDSDEKFFREFPVARPRGSGGVLLSNVSTGKEWSRRGRVSLSISPGAGEVRFEISRMDELYASPTEVAWSLLRAFASHQGVYFAQTNVLQRVQDELLLYSASRSVFRHREFLGWMGYVSDIVTEAQVPNAARLEILGSGTLVLSVNELDLGNSTSIMQANQVEISLAELGLLPVTDAGLN